MPMSLSLPDNVKEDILLVCRHGELEDARAFVEDFGGGSLAEIFDENGNSILHMASANGHEELLDFLLPRVPSQLLVAQNNSGSTALHWAAVNKQLEISRKLVFHPNGPGRDLIDIKNNIGRSALGEAEVAGWDEGAKLFVEMMRLDADKPQEQLIKDDKSFGDNKGAKIETLDAEDRMEKMSFFDSTDCNRITDE